MSLQYYHVYKRKVSEWAVTGNVQQKLTAYLPRCEIAQEENECSYPASEGPSKNEQWKEKNPLLVSQLKRKENKWNIVNIVQRTEKQYLASSFLFLQIRSRCK